MYKEATTELPGETTPISNRQAEGLFTNEDPAQPAGGQRTAASERALTDDASSGPPATARPSSEHLRLRAKAGPASLDVDLSVTPRGLLAIGGLVAGILLSTAVLVQAATSVARRHPWARAFARR